MSSVPESETGEPRWTEGDLIEVRGHHYKVEQADVIPNRDRPDRVLQYRLEALDGPAATLHVNGDGSGYVLQEYHGVDPDAAEKYGEAGGESDA